MKRNYLYRNWVLILLFFLIVITYLDRICISLLGVRIKTELRLTNEQFGWVVGAFALAYAIFEIPSGAWGDRIGQRKTLIRIVLWWSFFTAVTGVTTGLVSLIVARFLFGMGEAGAFPNSSAVISRWFPAAETSRALSSLFIGTNTGAAIAPLIIVPIAAAFGWRVPFFVIGSLGLVWVLVCFLWFKNEPSEMVKMTSEEKNFIESHRHYKRQHHRISWKSVLKNRSLRALVFSYYANQFAFYFFIAWMPIYLQEARHFFENEMKIISAIIFIFGIIGAFSGGLLSDWLVKRNGVRFARRLMGGFSMGVSGLAMFTAGSTDDRTLNVVCLIIGYLFLVINIVISFSICLDIGCDHVGAVAGLMNFSGQIGAFSIAILFGRMVEATHNFNNAFFLISPVLFAGSLCWLVIDPRKPFMLTGEDNRVTEAALDKLVV